MPNQDYIPKYIFSDYITWKGDWELIKGSPVSMSPSPKKKHQLTSGEIFKIFSNFFDKTAHKCNCNIYYELDWKVEDDTVLRPDLMIVCDEKESDFVERTPSLIVEVLSASTQLKDRNTKFSIYEQCGVAYYIMVNPDSEKIEIYQLIDNRYKEVKITAFEVAKNCVINVNLESIFSN
ncbi:MAG: Uma2 family endonuclease [Chitinophagales bacterium]